MTGHAAHDSPRSAQPDDEPDVEYRLSPQYRRPALVRFLFAAPATVVLAVTGLPILDGAAAITGALALYSGVSYLWRGRFRTRVTSRGIEARGYFNHFIPWDEVRDIELSGFGTDQAPFGESAGTSQYARAGIGGTRFSASRNTDSQMSRLASITLVRADGHKLRLRAPLVSGWAPDPDFDDKARQLEQLCVRYGRGAVG